MAIKENNERPETRFLREQFDKRFSTEKLNIDQRIEEIVKIVDLVDEQINISGTELDRLKKIKNKLWSFKLELEKER